MDLSKMEPPHTEILDGMRLKFAIAKGVYRKVNGEVYGIVRIVWCHLCSENSSDFVLDDCYYLYDTNGNGGVMEREELREVIGEDSFIQSFSYNEIVGVDL